MMRISQTAKRSGRLQQRRIKLMIVAVHFLLKCLRIVGVNAWQRWLHGSFCFLACKHGFHMLQGQTIRMAMALQLSSDQLASAGAASQGWKRAPKQMQNGV